MPRVAYRQSCMPGIQSNPTLMTRLGPVCGLCDPGVVRFVVENGRKSIDWLIDLGVNFTRFPDPGGQEYHLHQEGGHSHRRVLHAADSTGKVIENTLESCTRAHENIELFEFHTSLDLIVRDAAASAPMCMTRSGTG